MTRSLLAVVLSLLVAAPARAQQPTVRLETRGVAGTITANGGAVTLSNVGGLASLMVQTVGTFNLTWELQCAGDGTTFDADDEIPVTLVSSAPTPADSVATNVEGLYTATIAGCSAVRVIATTYSSGTMVVTLTAITSGGSSGGGGGAGSAVSITQGGNTAAVNASSQLSVTCANCSGSGASDIEGSTFTLGTDSVAPMGAYVDETAPTAATEDRMSTPRLTTQRALHVNNRDAAGAQLMGTAAALANTTANPTLGALASFQMVFNGTTWDRWTGLVSLAANQSVNVAQINGVTPLMGAGASGTGSPRVVTATDSTIGTVTTVSTVTNLAQFGGTNIVNGGTAGALATGGIQAADAAIASNNPTLIGGFGSSTVPTAMSASGDLTRPWYTLFGAENTVIRDTAGDSAVDATLDAVKVTNATASTASSYLTMRLSDGSNFLVPSSDSTHDSAIATTGPAIMGEATTALTADTYVADGDATRLKADDGGRLITTPGCGRQDRLRGYLANTDGASTSVLAAQGANIIAEIWSVTIGNSSAAAVSVDLRDGTAGSVLTTIVVPAGATAGAAYSSPILFTANTAVAADASAATSTLYITVTGCKIK